MRLHHNTASPYVRKVMAVAIETGLDQRLDMVSTAVNPVDPHDDLNRHNPLGKIPALVLDDGTILYDSRVICEYLDTLHDGHRLFPSQGSARWTALRRQALADGMSTLKDNGLQKVREGLTTVEEVLRVCVSED